MINDIIDEIQNIVKGKEDKIKVILASFFASQHVLIDDIPGVGKTTIAKTISKVLGLEFKRLQFTADMLPSDIVGVNYFDMQKKEFVFKKGAVFTQILLADEINRATPKAQSALLEAMEEKQVSIDGYSYPLSKDFFVIATQNPIEHGIYPLPLSQIDRFGVSLDIGYPQQDIEKLILKREEIKVRSFKEATSLKQNAKDIHISDSILDMILQIAQISRSGIFEVGLSTRALIAIKDILKSYAMIQGRKFVIDQDVVDILPYCVNHRLRDKDGAKKILRTIL